MAAIVDAVLGKARPAEPEIRPLMNAADQLVYQYTTREIRVARLLSGYLLVAFVVGLWVLADAFDGQSALANWFKAEDSKFQDALVLIVLAMAAGWLGATISALRSLCEHYSSTVENAASLAKQEAERFHTEWAIRWILGPWEGAGLGLFVFALVRSGVLLFGGQGLADGDTRTVTSELSSIGLGGLVGLGAKEVVEKLTQVLKSALRLEEEGAKPLQLSPQNASVKCGGQAVRFTVIPNIAVTWEAKPDNMGSITNGVFVSSAQAPAGISGSPIVVITATSKSDANRSATAVLTLEKSA